MLFFLLSRFSFFPPFSSRFSLFSLIVSDCSPWFPRRPEGIIVLLPHDRRDSFRTSLVQHFRTSTSLQQLGQKDKIVTYILTNRGKEKTRLMVLLTEEKCYTQKRAWNCDLSSFTHVIHILKVQCVKFRLLSWSRTAELEHNIRDCSLVAVQSSENKNSCAFGRYSNPRFSSSCGAGCFEERMLRHHVSMVTQTGQTKPKGFFF